MARALRIPIPVGGRPYGVPPQEIRNDQLADAKNVYIEDGTLRDRRGFQEFHDTNFPLITDDLDALLWVPSDTLAAAGVRITSGFFAWAGTWHQTSYPGDTWENVDSGLSFDPSPTVTIIQLGLGESASPLATGTNAGVRSHTFPLAGKQSTVIVSGNSGTKPEYFTWSDDPATVNMTQLANAPAGARDVISADARLVLGLVTFAGSSEIHVSAVNDMTTWPSGLFATIDDTGDVFRGFSALNRSSFIMHKSLSQWMATGTPNAAFPFRFDQIGSFAGPISSRAIVSTESDVYWIGRNGVIYKARGTQISVANTAISRHVSRDITLRASTTAHGAYLPRFRQIWWFYPSLGEVSAATTNPLACIVYDIDSNTAWLQGINGATTSDSVKSSLGFPALDANNADIGLFVGAATGSKLIYMLRDGGGSSTATIPDWQIVRGDGGGTEAGTGNSIAASFQTAVRAYAGPQNKTIIRSYQPMFRKEASVSNLVTIDFLGGDYPDSLSTLHSVTIDPSDTNRPIIDNLSVEANWVSIKHSWTVESDHGRFWDGGILWADGIDEGVR